MSVASLWKRRVQTKAQNLNSNHWLLLRYAVTIEGITHETKAPFDYAPACEIVDAYRRHEGALLQFIQHVSPPSILCARCDEVLTYAMSHKWMYRV
jgi:hypothetical protein